MLVVSHTVISIVILLAVLLYSEFFVYYLVLYQCRWPEKLNNSLKAMLLADTHLLGPFKGHWFDKLRREWQMHRAFQTTIFLHRPDVVFILGDIFDEGQWVTDDQFKSYLLRFHQLFHTPEHIKVYNVVGNHDVGFHYRLYPRVLDRFKNAFNESNNSLITIKDTHFVLINSMTMDQDGCYFCDEAEKDIRKISQRLQCAKNNSKSTCNRVHDELPFYARPVILQHYPSYRKSDAQCEENDSPEIEIYREMWEVLSKQATQFLVQRLNPRVSFSGHSHHYCRILNSRGVEEFTIASFSWRNKENPSFLLVEFTKDDYAVSKCDMPKENTVIAVYYATGFLIAMVSIYGFLRPKFKKKYIGKEK